MTSEDGDSQGNFPIPSKDEIFEKLSKQQKKAVDMALDEKQKLLCIMGIPGCGKSYLIKRLVILIALKVLGEENLRKIKFDGQCFRDTFDFLLVVAYTGNASKLIYGGQTIHSAFKIPIYIDPSEFDPFRNLDEMKNTHPEKYNKLEKKITSLRYVIVEEFGFLDEQLMLQMHAVCSYFKKPSERDYSILDQTPFGGLKVIFVGDPAQLPPPSTTLDENGKVKGLIYQSLFWKKHFGDHCEKPSLSKETIEKINHSYVVLDENRRVLSDPLNRAFDRITKKMRLFPLSTEERDFLMKYSCQKQQFEKKGSDWTHIFSTRKEVDSYNRKKFMELVNQKNVKRSTFKNIYIPSISTVKAIFREKYGEPINGDQVSFCVGCRVRVLVNIYEEKRKPEDTPIVNGTIAKIVDIVNHKFTVNGNEYNVECPVLDIPGRTETYTLKPSTLNERFGTENVYKKELPLKLCYASTVHAFQGMELDKMSINAEKNFTYSQLLVAITRCTNLRNIYFETPLKENTICPIMKHFVETIYNIMGILLPDGSKILRFDSEFNLVTKKRKIREDFENHANTYDSASIFKHFSSALPI